MKQTFSYTGGQETKADPLLTEFMRYCVEHPEERFWQALKNWSGVPFICFYHGKLEDMPKNLLQDTYYKTGRNS